MQEPKVMEKFEYVGVGGICLYMVFPGWMLGCREKMLSVSLIMGWLDDINC